MLLVTGLGAVDVGTATKYKILRPNGGYIRRSTVCAWTHLEEANARLLVEWASFMMQLNDESGPVADPEDFLYLDLTPELKYYADGVEDGFDGDS